MPELKSGNHNTVGFGVRAAMNMPMQGSAADLIKLAMVRINKRIRDEGLKSLMITQVHDELVFDAPEDEVATLKSLVEEEMSNVAKLSVPLLVEVEVRETL